MNVYDFDKTVFYPDSSYCFILFELKRRPGILIPHLLSLTAVFFRWRLKKISTTEFKQELFSFLGKISDRQKEVDAFWEKNIGKVRKWYLAQNKPDDLIISASPEFLLKPVSEKLGFELIATKMDIRTGKIDGLNCHDSEKVSRYREKYGNTAVNEFYSDSFSDTPMAEIAEKAFLVKKDKITVWPK